MMELFSFGHSKHGQLGRDGSSETPGLVLSGALSGIACGGVFSSAIISGNILSWGDARGIRPTQHHAFRNPMYKLVSGSTFTLGLDYEGDIYYWSAAKEEHGLQLPYLRKLEGACQPFGKTKPQIISMAAGATFALFLDNKGHIYAFGDGPSGQCGLKASQLSVSQPELISHFANGGKVIAVACGGHHSMALSVLGRVWTWGNNEFGQLGHAPLEDAAAPKLLVFPHRVISIAAGEYHSFLLTSEKTLYAFGKNDQGQLGLGTTSPFESYPQLVVSLDQVKSVVAGGGLRCSHSLALAADGSLYSWGSGGSGQLGYPLDPKKRYQETPKKIDFGEKEVVDFACGWLHTLVLTKGHVVAPPLSSFIVPHGGLSSLDLLPTDVLGLILDSLNVIDASRLGICSRILFGFTSSPSFWKRAFYTDLLPDLSDNTAQKYVELFDQACQVNWKSEYIKCCALLNTVYLPVETFDQYMRQQPSQLARLQSARIPGVTIPLSFSKPVSLLMLGYPNAGKKTILEKLSLGRGVPINKRNEDGLAIMQLNIPNCQIIAWDTATTRHLDKWKQHQPPDCLIWVLDSSERGNRQNESYNALGKLLKEGALTNMPIIIFENKQDLYDIVSSQELNQILKLKGETRMCTLCPCIATEGTTLSVPILPTSLPCFAIEGVAVTMEAGMMLLGTGDPLATVGRVAILQISHSSNSDGCFR